MFFGDAGCASEGEEEAGLMPSTKKSQPSGVWLWRLWLPYATMSATSAVDKGLCNADWHDAMWGGDSYLAWWITLEPTSRLLQTQTNRL
eukprot:4417447-Amphidinium_carterae.1